MFRKLIPFSLILILAMAAIISMSTAYGSWTSVLVANGALQTGTFNPVFQNVSTSHTPDYGECSAKIVNADGQLPQVVFAIAQAYPGFQCTISLEIKNNGNIPVALQKAVYYPAENDQTSVFVWGPRKPTCGETLAPGESKLYDFTYAIPLTLDPPQNTTYKNSVEFTIVQFNAYSPSGCAVSP